MSDDDARYAPRSTDVGVSDPAALAVASLVLGVLSLGGFGLVNGSTYVFPLTLGQPSTVRTVLVLRLATFALYKPGAVLSVAPATIWICPGAAQMPALLWCIAPPGWSCA